MLDDFTLYQIFAFIFGLLLGSFANVCIVRIPLERSVVFPRSHCGRCGNPIPFYDNLPLVSFLLLRGKCRRCATPFRIRYLLVEVLCGCIAWQVYREMGFSFQAFYLLAFLIALLIVSAIDIEHRIIPDSISLGGLALGLFVALLATINSFSWPVTLRESLLGAMVGGGMLWMVGRAYEWLSHREGMGLGDVKLLAMFGAHSGVMGVLNTIVYASLLGSLMGLFLVFGLKKGRYYAIPFGPYLCLGFILHFLFGTVWTSWIDRGLDFLRF